MAREPQSRAFRRCCYRRLAPPHSGGPPQPASRLKLPDTPLILAGALGGPLCIFMTTPLRNALTLASQDPESSAWELYGSVFQAGFASGWTGGWAPVIPSCPQFCVLGPLFHFLNEYSGNVVLAVLMSAFVETAISYSSNTINAQMAFNHEQLMTGGGAGVPLWNPFSPFGPGSLMHVLRNVVALAGIRIFSSPCLKALGRTTKAAGLELPDSVRLFLGDFIACMGAGMLSAPMNQLYNFAVTSNEYLASGLAEQAHLLSEFLASAYLVHGRSGEVIGLSPTLPRDMFMRCSYVATIMALFAAIERTAVSFWKKSKLQA